MAAVSLFNAITDPTTKGIGDSHTALTYDVPKKQKVQVKCMEPIQELLHIDFIQFIFTTLIIMSGITSIVMVVAKFAEFIGKPIKWFNRNNKDHDLLIQTVNSVAELQSKHHEDIENMKQAQKRKQ